MTATSEIDGRISSSPQPGEPSDLPGDGLATQKMPGHWLLARLGKRVLRPGGIGLTRWLIRTLQLSNQDDVVELAPGLGITAEIALKYPLHSYIGVERDPNAAAQVAKVLHAPTAKCIVGNAEDTGLSNACASVVLGEAMLSMQPQPQKERIVAEVSRLLKPQGRYAIHELCLVPDNLPQSDRDAMERDLSQAIHVGVKLLSVPQWRQLLEAQGLEVVAERHAGMHLLQPWRMLRDEGLPRSLKIAFNLLRDRAARRRVFQMRAVFRRHAKHLSAIALVAKKSS